MRKLSNQQKWMLAFALLFFATAKIVAVFWWQSKDEPVNTTSIKTVTCDVKTGCQLPNGAVLTFKGNIGVRAPFEITLDHVDQSTEASIQFEMVDMEMGFNRYKLVDNPTIKNQMHALSVYLPVCVAERKDYLAILNLGGQRYQIAFTAK